LYVGGTKLVALRARFDDGGGVFVEAWQKRDPEGFSKSAVSDVDLARSQAREILCSVAGEAPLASMPFYVVVSSAKMRHYKTSSSLYFGRNKGISEADVREVLQQTKAVATLPLDEVIVSSFPQEYLVNDLAGINNPIGLEGKRLGVSLHLYSMPGTMHRALVDLWDQIDIEPDRIFPSALASVYGVTDEQERNEGVIGIDMGARSVELAFFFRGGLRYFKRLQGGGDDLTEWISKTWDVSLREAARMKEEYGAADLSGSLSRDMMPVIDERGNVKTRLPAEEFVRRMAGKVKEGVEDVAKEILAVQKEYAHLHHAVITGGPARLQGLIELYQSVLDIPCRAGLVKGVQGPWELVGAPAHTSAVGVLKALDGELNSGEKSEGRNLVAKSFETVRSWIQDYF